MTTEWCNCGAMHGREHEKRVCPNTWENRRVRVWISPAAKQALLEMCPTLPLMRFKQVADAWQVELDPEMWTTFSYQAYAWKCDVSQAIIMINKQEHV